MQSRVSAIPRRCYVDGSTAAPGRAHPLARAQSEPWITRWEVALLLAICSLDMLSSVVLFHHQLAVEANPLLRPFVETDLTAFVYAKLITFVPALLAADWYSRRRPEFIQGLLRTAIVGYVGIYLFAVGRQFIG